MRNLRRTIQLEAGVKVDTLFTPHLFSFKEEKGLTLQITEDIGSVLETYADIYYLAALNAWVLDGHGSVEDFPHTRGDFHAYMMVQPVQFAKDVDFAVQALTGKSLKEMKPEEKPAETPVESKKKRCGWIGRLLRRSS